tara:strand:- start:842 stop:1096 length:255 start_codon:yes stop_codon:yes gene_type:complete
MFNRTRAALAVLKKGKVVADPARWKKHQITATVLAAFIWSLVNASSAFGFEIFIGEETVDAVAVGIIALVNWVFTLSTSEKVGL